MTPSRNQSRNHEGLGWARLFMTLSSLSPLFILWAIRGQKLIPDIWFVPACLLMALLPTLCLLVRIYIAKKGNDKWDITIGSAENHKTHVLSYLFAILLPFYREELETYRDLFAMLAALAFIVFLFLYLNLYYLNILFPIFQYQAFIIWPPEDDNPYTGKEPFTLITSRYYLISGDRLKGYRLSNTVYLEVQA